MDTPTKRCKTCLRDLPLDAFHKNIPMPDGHVNFCIECVNAKRRQKRAADPEEQRTKDREHYSKNKERIQLRRGHTPWEKFPDGFKRCNRCKQLLTVDQFNADKRRKDKKQGMCRSCCRQLKFQWQRTQGQTAEQKKKSRDKAMQWHRTHPGHQMQRYHQNPHNILMAQHRRRAKKLNLPNTFSADDWRHCLDWFNHRCAYCGNPQGLLQFTKLSADHWIPLSDPACPGTIPTNMIPACRSCNSSKNDTMPEVWLVDKFGKGKAKQIMKRVISYFTAISYTGT